MEGKEPIKFDSKDQEQPSNGNSELSYLQSELEVVREENQKLHWEVNGLIKDMQRLRSQPSSAEEDLVVVQDENEQLRSQVVKMIKDMDGLQKELNTVRSASGDEDLKKIQSELDVAQDRLKSAKAENEKLRHADEEKIEEVNKLQERLTKAKHRFDLGKVEFEKLRSQEAQKTEELTKLQGELKDYQEKFESAKAENEKLGSQESGKSEELARLQNELKGYQEKVDLAKIENEKLRSQESGKSGELAELRTELKENQEKLNAVQVESEKWQLQEKEKSREITKLKTELSGYSEKFELSKAENENLIAQKKEEFEVVDTLTSELKSTSEKLDLLKVENEKLLLQDGARSDELKKLQTERSELLGQLDKVKAEKKKADTKDSEKLDELESLKLELESARKELAIEKNKPVKLNVLEADSEKQEVELQNTREALDLAKNKNQALNLQLENQEKKIQKLSDLIADGRAKEQIKNKGEETKVEKDVNQVDSKPDIIDYEVKQDETPTARVGKFRKYQGYKNPEEKKEEGSASLLDLVKEYRDRMANGESMEEIALSIAQLNPEKLQGDEESDETSDKSKAYSPNRSFGDLLEDSERRQVASAQRVEANWSDDDKDTGKVYVEGSNKEIESMPEKSSIKPLLIAGVLAAVALGVGGSLLFSDKADDLTVKDDDSTAKSSEVVSSPLVTQTGEDTNTAIVENADEPSTTNIALDLTSDTLKENALNILRNFHEAKELEKKASFCRVPVRTLATMKSFYTGVDDTIAVPGLRITPELVTLGDLKLVKADVITKVGDVVGARLAFFEIDSEGELKLDWFNYIDSEAGTWDKYTQSDDATSIEWKVKLDFDGDEHPDFIEEEYAAMRVRSFSSDAINVVNAYIKKSDPKYQDLIDAYQTGQQVFILKLRNLLDETGSFIVDEVVSLHSFYTVDIVSTEEK